LLLTESILDASLPFKELYKMEKQHKYDII